MFVAADRVDEVLATAREIWQKEREQAVKIRAGETLRVQTAFDDYLAQRAEDPSYTFRRHLRLHRRRDRGVGKQVLLDVGTRLQPD